LEKRKRDNAREMLVQGPFTFGECSVDTESECEGAAVFAADGQPLAMFSSDCFVGGKEEALGAAELICDLLNIGRTSGLMEDRAA
jgi:hypothetical protein